MLGNILRDVDGMTLGLDVGAYLVSFDESFDGSNDSKLKGLLL